MSFVVSVIEGEKKECSTRKEACEMQPFIVDIVNNASAEGARILITSDLVRLAFGDRDATVRFLERMAERAGSCAPHEVSADFRRVDYSYTPQLCACA